MKKHCTQCNNQQGKTFLSYVDFLNHIKNTGHTELNQFEVLLDQRYVIDLNDVDNWTETKVREGPHNVYPTCDITGEKMGQPGEDIFYFTNVEQDLENGETVELGTIVISKKVKKHIERNQSNKKLSAYN